MGGGKVALDGFSRETEHVSGRGSVPSVFLKSLSLSVFTVSCPIRWSETTMRSDQNHTRLMFI